MFSSSNKGRNLPLTKGPYAPGCVDIMLDYAQTGILVRLYYPTKRKHNEVNSSMWIPWAAEKNYFIGGVKLILFLPIVGRIIHWLASDLLSPVLYGEKIKTDDKIPCVVLSHGLAGNRLFYSIVSSELASHGYLVAIVEHRDHSAGYTYFYNSKKDAEADIKTHLYGKVIPIDSNCYNECNKRVHYRANECSKVLDLLIDLNDGKIPHNVLNDLKSANDVAFDWKDFTGLLDLSTLTMAGHSFGGATALYTLSIRKEFKQGIIMDPWMFPIKNEKNVVENVTQPLIFINSETFQTSTSVADMAKYMKTDKTEMYTILHTSHEIQADMVFITGFLLNMFKKKLKPQQASDICSALILSFLEKHTGHPVDVRNHENCLKKEGENIAKGLTKPWN